MKSYILNHRKLFAIGSALALLITVALLKTTNRAYSPDASGKPINRQQQADEEEREIILKRGQNHPAIEITKIKNLRKKTWLADLEIVVTNVSSKPVYYIRLLLDFPDIKYGDKIKTLPLRYGDARLGNFSQLAGPNDIPIQPGERYIFKIPEIIARGNEKYLKRIDPDGKLTRKLHLQIEEVSFGDGTGVYPGGYIGGIKSRQSSYTPEPGNKPRFQKASFTFRGDFSSTNAFFSASAKVIPRPTKMSSTKKTTPAQVKQCSTGCAIYNDLGQVVCAVYPPTGQSLCAGQQYSWVSESTSDLSIPCLRVTTDSYDDCVDPDTGNLVSQCPAQSAVPCESEPGGCPAGQKKGFLEIDPVTRKCKKSEDNRCGTDQCAGEGVCAYSGEYDPHNGCVNGNCQEVSTGKCEPNDCAACGGCSGQERKPHFRCQGVDCVLETSFCGLDACGGEENDPECGGTGGGSGGGG
ncbi:MAG TPA: hypothetical protein VNQ79_22710, partial [Blastocatellia bacterium]|nr:hypothetical protein [Blastocatellia bacterium]